MVDFDKVRDMATANIDSLYPPDKHRKGIICPICGNGQGRDGDGVGFVKTGSPILKCFRCGFSGDVITMTAKARNITYQEAAEILAEKLGMTDEKYQYRPDRPIVAFEVPKFEHAKEEIPEEKIDQTEYFKKVEKYLSKTDYPAQRGLSPETCRHFRLGYDAIWKHPKVPNAPTSPRLIIPTSKYSYLARDVRTNLSEDQKRYSKQKFGSVSVFNARVLEYEFVFVTEGEIDAMSFYEVCKANALALGSVSNIQKFVDYLKTAPKRPTYLIAALDNDVAGQEANLKLKQALKELGIHTLIADCIYKDFEKNIDYKDANEFLVKDREAFIRSIKLIWKVSPEGYESDKLASQMLREKGLLPSEDALAEPEFTKENLQSMFEEKFTSEELEQMISQDNPQPVGLERVQNVQNETENAIDIEVDNDPDFAKGRFPINKLPQPDKEELAKAVEYLKSIPTFDTVDKVYDPKTLQAVAYCRLYAPRDCRELFVEKVGNYISKRGWMDYTTDYCKQLIKKLRKMQTASELQSSDAEEKITVAPVKVEESPVEENSTQPVMAEKEIPAQPVPEAKEELTPTVSPVETVTISKQIPVAEIPVETTTTETSATSTEPITPQVKQVENIPVVAPTLQPENASIPPEVSELKKSTDLLKSITEFKNETVFAIDILQAAAYCKVYAPLELVKFLEHCRENKIKLTLLNEYIRQYARSIAKIKRRDDKKKEQEQLIEETKRKQAEFKIIRYNNSIRMGKLLNEPQSPERDQNIIQLIQDSLERDRHGKVISTSVTNFELALNFDPTIRGCVGYDAFSQRIVPRRKLPWTDGLSSKTQIAWANYDDAGLQNYLNRTYELNNERVFFNVISEYAHKNSFHPVQDYFNNLPKWDGITRAAEYFIDNLEIDDSSYTREVVKSWMMAAVARVFHPGCKWDYALVIKGAQGVGKSTVFSKLAGKWFNDSIENIGGKETLENLLGSWIIELCEMQATKKADNEIIKSFLSRQIDKFRVPYGRRTEEFLRQCVFAATTNDEEFLKDRTGNRRFLVLVSKAKEDSCRARLAKIGADQVDQIWSEIFYYYNQLFATDKTFDASKLLPSEETLKTAADIRKEYTEGSSLEGLIDAYLEIKLPESEIWEQRNMAQRRKYIQNYSEFAHEGTVQRKIVSAVEIAYELLLIDNPAKEKSTLKEINKILSQKEGWHRTTWKRVGVYGQQRIAFNRY